MKEILMNLHLQLPIILVAGALAEAGGRRLGIPAVVAQVIVGVVLGPSLVGLLPSIQAGPYGATALDEIARIGLCVLLFKIGLETELKLFQQVWRQATIVAIVGVVIPFLSGWGLMWILGWSNNAALFAGATLTATSIGVTMAVLDELRAQSSREATIILGAAVLDDLLGLVLLAILTSLTVTGSTMVGQTLTSLGLASGFIIAGMWLGPYLVNGLIRTASWTGNRSALLVLAFAYLLFLGLTAEKAKLAMILGAYVAGLAFSGHSERKQLATVMEPLVATLTPLFFVLVGASVEFQLFGSDAGINTELLTILAALLVAAIAGKMFSALLLRDGNLNRVAIGYGMLPRGEVGLIFAQVGLNSGAISGGEYSTLVMVLITTTLIGPLMLRRAWKKTSVEIGTSNNHR